MAVSGQEPGQYLPPRCVVRRICADSSVRQSQFGDKYSALRVAVAERKVIGPIDRWPVAYSAAATDGNSKTSASADSVNSLRPKIVRQSATRLRGKRIRLRVPSLRARHTSFPASI